MARVREVRHQLGYSNIVKIFFLQIISVLPLEYLILMIIVPRSLVRVTKSSVGLTDVLELLSSVYVLVLIWVPL